ncbi:MAG: arylesterase [Bacteroidota bacterium]
MPSLIIKNIRVLLVFLLLGSCTPINKEKTQENQSGQPAMNETITSKENRKIILFFGNSITAGYQLDMEQAFPALIQKKLDSLDFGYTAINAGLSGETSAGGRGRIDWVLKTTPDIFFLELGANDGLRGLPLEETPRNLQAIIDKVKEANPEVKIIIAGMMVPPNLGDDYTSKFQAIFPELAQENDAVCIPFLLDGVAGNPELNLPDGVHPTAEGHEIVADMVWNHLGPLL